MFNLFIGKVKRDGVGFVEWVMIWVFGGVDGGVDGFFWLYCNIVLIMEGGMYESGFWFVLMWVFKSYGELIGNKCVVNVIVEDVIFMFGVLLFVFILNFEF